MPASRAAVLVLSCLFALPLAACVVMPRDGTPVFVERRAGDFWSGEGKLLEVSADRRRCRVAVRTTAGVVERRWLDCRYVHARAAR